MADMAMGASWRTASWTATSVVNSQAPLLKTTPTAAASSTPRTAPLLRQGAGVGVWGVGAGEEARRAWGGRARQRQPLRQCCEALHRAAA